MIIIMFFFCFNQLIIIDYEEDGREILDVGRGGIIYFGNLYSSSFESNSV